MAVFLARDRDSLMAHRREKVHGNSSAQTKTIILGGRVAGNVVSRARDGERPVGYWLRNEFPGRGVATWALTSSWRQGRVS